MGNTSKDDYAEYVSACIERGFDEDYSREENSYRACDDEGWDLTLRYEGGKVMSISIDAPEEEEPENVAEQDEKPESDAQPEKEDEPAKETEKTDEPAKEPEKDNGGLDPDFKKAMDSYEEFMDEYVDFMKRYNKSGGTDLGLMLEYTEYLTDYSEFCESFAEWDEGEMNDAELAYYLDVQTRVNKKLLEVTG